MKPLLILVSAGLVAACVSPEDPSEFAVTERSFLRGTNSPTVGDGLLFDELDSSGLPNRNELKIVGAYLPGRIPVRLHVYRHDLIVSKADGTQLVRQGLVGLTILLTHPVQGMYELMIASVNDDDLAFWTGDPEVVPAYEFKARKYQGEFVNKKFLMPFEYACREDILSTDPAWTGVPHSAVVFQGDYYDPDRKTVTTVPDEFPLDADSRFNVACPGTAPGKMHLSRHTRAGSINAKGNLVYPTNINQRQAMLKMFTADYCGTGRSFTVDGQPLAYSDPWTHFAPWSEAFPIEAAWKAGGARCLNVPRRGAVLLPEIAQECGGILPPPCTFRTTPPLGSPTWGDSVISALLP
jgi:hypothetical protein